MKTQIAPPAPPQVSVVTVQRTSVPVTAELPGRTTPALSAHVGDDESADTGPIKKSFANNRMVCGVH